MMTDQETNCIEQWEIVSEGTVWVWSKDVRNPGSMKKVRVGGKSGGSKRLRITRDERRYNEEQIVEEMSEHNPFKNGTLRFLSAEDKQTASDIDTTNMLTSEDLRGLLSIKDQALFKSEVDGIVSELILRRLHMIAETDATVSQLETIKEAIDDKYRVGGTQRTVREMLAQGERVGGEVLSQA